MPHGSGGGSHSGGSHGSRSHSSSHRSSYRPPRPPRPPRYHHNYYNTSYYGHSYPPPPPPSSPPLQPQDLGSTIVGVILSLPFLAIGCFLIYMALQSFFPCTPLKMDYETHNICIEDNARILDKDTADMAQLNANLKSFKDKTGIEPYIITVYDSEWQDKYDNLGNYAYDLYVNRFSDEKHFLIVYSEPENADELLFVNWSWEGMQGNETDSIITAEKLDRFREDLQEYLTRSTVTTTQAFGRTFENSLKYIMNPTPDYRTALIKGVFALLFLIVGFSILRSNIKRYRLNQV